MKLRAGYHQRSIAGLRQGTASPLTKTALKSRYFPAHLHATGNPADWANPSFAFAKAAWVEDGGSVDEDYYRREIKVVDERCWHPAR